ncbi:MAG: symmetrical bis(5'-nucleosyl)-tetraphosphatase [Xanthomonadales bacterium]|nr:symmetrical bis(5'-nucleosyl)-tetraphosphatase [Xanthomonadales bacterium]
MATYVVGDLQGCYDALQRLLEKIGFDPARDQLWSTGDLVNRGGQSLETLRLLHGMGTRFRMVMGNHDLYLLKENWKFPDGGCGNREMEAILQAHDRHILLDWLQHQPLALWSGENALLMVHAGVIPQWTVEQTLGHAAEIETVLRSGRADRFFSKMNKSRVRRWRDDREGWKRRRLISNILTQLRFCDANGKILANASGPPGSQPAPYKPWFEHPHRKTRDATIVFGHWAALGLYIEDKLVGLDSGAVWGGRLSAWRLEDGKVFQVPGKFHPQRIFLSKSITR